MNKFNIDNTINHKKFMTLFLEATLRVLNLL